MKFLLPALLSAALLISPVMADDQIELQNIPEAVLMDGLDTVAVCMVTDAVAVRELAELAENASPDDLKEIEKQANDLMLALVFESQLGTGLIEFIVNDYHHTNEELGKKLEELSQTTRDELNEQIKNVTTYLDFKQVYTSRLSACTHSLESWVQQISPNALEKKKQLHM